MSPRDLLREYLALSDRRGGAGGERSWETGRPGAAPARDPAGPVPADHLHPAARQGPAGGLQREMRRWR